MRYGITDPTMNCVISAIPATAYQVRGIGAQEWINAPPDMRFPRQDIDQWLRKRVGPRQGETFCVDRVYYPDETPPALQSGWQANASTWRSDTPRWSIIRTDGWLLANTIVLPDMESAMLFKLQWGGVLQELTRP